MSEQSMMKNINSIVEETMHGFLFEENTETMRGQLEFEIIESLLEHVSLSQDFEVEVSRVNDYSIEVMVQLLGVGSTQMTASIEEVETREPTIQIPAHRTESINAFIDSVVKNSVVKTGLSEKFDHAMELLN